MITNEELKTILSLAFIYLQILAFVLAGLRDENYQPEPPKREVNIKSYGDSILLHLPRRTE